MIPWSFQMMLLLLVVIAALFDVRYRRIPNWLVGTGLAFGIAANTLLFGWNGIMGSLGGSAIAFVIYIPLFILRAIGAGDVKLMMAIGAVVGPINWLLVFLITCILGAVIAVLILVWRKQMRQTLWHVVVILGEIASLRPPYLCDSAFDIRSPRANTMPHGATIAIGSAVFLIGRLYLV